MDSTPVRPRRLWVRVPAGLVAVLVIGAAAGVGLFRLAALTVPAYRHEVEQWASRTVGVPLTIRGIEARWSGLGPELVLDSVVLKAPHRRTPLAGASQIVVHLSIPVMIENGRLLPSGVTIRGLRLTVRQNAAGHWQMPWAKPGEPHSFPFATLLAVSAHDARLQFRDAVIRLIPSATRPPTLLQVSRFRIAVRADQYRMMLSMRAEPHLVRMLDLRVRAQGSRTDPGLWPWRVRGEVLDLAPAALVPLGLVLPVQGLDGSRLSVTLAGAGMGRHPARLHGSLTAMWPDRGSRPGPLHPGRVRIQGGFRVNWIKRRAVLSPIVVARPGHPARREDLEIGWSGAVGGRVGYRIGAQRFFLGTLLPFVPLAGPSTALRPMANLLGRLRPTGRVVGLDVRLGLTPNGWDVRSATGRFERVGWSAWRGWPGFGGFSGHFAATGRNGSVFLRPSTVTFRDPGIFSRPITLTWGGTVLSYEARPKGLLALTPTWIRSPGFSVAVHQAALRLPSGVGRSPTIRLDARLRNGRVPLMAGDIPYGIFGPGLRRWLHRALVAGWIPEAHLVLDGKLSDFPFSHGGGRFEVRFALRKAEVHIASGWPDLVVDRAEGVFAGPGFSVRIASGMEAGFPLAGSGLVIPHLKRGVLHIRGAFAGQAATLESYLDSTPLSRRWNGLFTALDLTGPLAASVRIRLPVHALDRPTIRGHVRFIRDRFRFRPWPLVLHRLKGDVTFDNLAVTAPTLTARLNGHRLTFNAWRKRKETHLQMVGALDVAKLGLPAPLARLVQGASDWQAELAYAPAHLTGRLRFKVLTHLVGTRLLLPAPLAKAAARSMTLDLTAALVQGDSRFRIAGTWKSIGWMGVRGRFVDGRPVLSAGRIDFGGRLAPLPAHGILVTGGVGETDLSGWWRLYRQIRLPGSGSPSVRIKDLHLARLTGWGQKLGPLLLSVAAATRTGFHFQVDGTDLAGTGFFPPAGSHRPVQLHFSRFEIAPLVHLAGSGTSHLTPEVLPALDWSSTQTRYGRIVLGNVIFDWTHPSPHALRCSHVALVSPDLRITGGGQWVWNRSGSRVDLNAKVTSPKVGSAFRQLDIKRILTGQQAGVALNLDWRGTPWHPDRTSLGGTIRFSVRDGRVLAIKPGGAGRFLALLSLNALPRRLGLDFSDVFSRGLSYDRLQGMFTIRRGVAVTHDATLFGSSIAIWLTGKTDLAKRSYDQVALVIPHVGSTLPIAGAIFGGPIGGGILLALSRIFRGVIESMSETYYHVTGPWRDPRVHRISAARARALGFVKKPG